MRAVVVGASSGLGRCIGIGLAQRGASVALLARRRQRLEDAFIAVDELVTMVDAVLRGGASISLPSVTVAPRPAIAPS